MNTPNQKRLLLPLSAAATLFKLDNLKLSDDHDITCLIAGAFGQTSY